MLKNINLKSHQTINTERNKTEYRNKNINNITNDKKENEMFMCMQGYCSINY